MQRGVPPVRSLRLPGPSESPEGTLMASGLPLLGRRALRELSRAATVM